MAKSDVIVNAFLIVIISQLFYSVAINLITYSTPADALEYVNPFSGVTDTINLEDTGADVENSLQRQTNMPLVDLGALAFYSGNIFIDLMLNFAFALPQMVTTLLTGFLMIFSIDTIFAHYIQLFLSVSILVVYVVLMLLFLAGLRTGRSIA